MLLSRDQENHKYKYLEFSTSPQFVYSLYNTILLVYDDDKGSLLLSIAVVRKIILVI